MQIIQIFVVDISTVTDSFLCYIVLGNKWVNSNRHQNDEVTSVTNFKDLQNKLTLFHVALTVIACFV